MLPVVELYKEWLWVSRKKLFGDDHHHIQFLHYTATFLVTKTEHSMCVGMEKKSQTP